jgi:DNA-binding NtrC family response regulator
MLVGEMGTGREAFARYMHWLGPRAAGLSSS